MINITWPNFRRHYYIKVPLKKIAKLLPLTVLFLFWISNFKLIFIDQMIKKYTKPKTWSSTHSCWKKMRKYFVKTFCTTEWADCVRVQCFIFFSPDFSSLGKYFHFHREATFIVAQGTYNRVKMSIGNRSVGFFFSFGRIFQHSHHRQRREKK